MMKVFFECVAFLMMVIASIAIVYTLIVGVNLTQGQLLIAFYPHYIVSIALIVGSCAIMNNIDDA
mgnify:CR=1 FL=1